MVPDYGMSKNKSFRSIVALLAVLSLNCASTTESVQSKVEPMSQTVQNPAVSIEKPAVAKTTLGIDPEHLKEVPLLDKFSFQSRGKINGTRTYRDGTVYIFSINTRGDGAQKKVLEGKKFLVVSPTGIEAIEAVIQDDLLEHTDTSSTNRPRTGSGHMIWVAYIGPEEHIRRTVSGSYASLPPWVQAIDEAIRKNVVPRTSP